MACTLAFTIHEPVQQGNKYKVRVSLHASARHVCKQILQGKRGQREGGMNCLCYACREGGGGEWREGRG